jgi:hypothetical protein
MSPTIARSKTAERSEPSSWHQRIAKVKIFSLDVILDAGFDSLGIRDTGTRRKPLSSLRVLGTFRRGPSQ